MLTEKISRRDFLKTSGALVVVFSVASPLAGAAEKKAARVASVKTSVYIMRIR